MKKLVIGGMGVISSAVLFGLTLVAAAVYSLYLSAPDIGGGFDSRFGLFSTALIEIGTIPLIMSALLFLGAVYYVIIGMKEK